MKTRKTTRSARRGTKRTKEEYWAVVQITTYNSEMHRLQYTQMNIYSGKELAREVQKIITRYPTAFTTAIWIKYRPFSEWPQKWSEV